MSFWLATVGHERPRALPSSPPDQFRSPAFYRQTFPPLLQIDPACFSIHPSAIKCLRDRCIILRQRSWPEALAELSPGNGCCLLRPLPRLFLFLPFCSCWRSSIDTCQPFCSLLRALFELRMQLQEDLSLYQECLKAVSVRLCLICIHAKIAARFPVRF